jgi:hypothetical protein
MQKQFGMRQSGLTAVVVVIFLSCAACEKRPQAAPGSSPTPIEQARPSLEIRPDAPPKVMEPATVGREPDSLASYVHFPKDAPVSSQSAVQFYCDVSAEGVVVTIYGIIGNDPAFKTAVQTALDWGHFKPAKIEGKPVAVYLGGTVLFFHQGGQPVIVISLATADRERVGTLSNYLQPQLIGGLGPRLEHANATLMWNRPWSGAAEVLFKVNERGQMESSAIVSEIPNGSGLGDLLRSIIQDGQWVPAYNNAKPTAGQINVVANFGEY